MILWEIQVTALLTWMEAWPSSPAVGTTPKADTMRMIQRIINSAMVFKMKEEMNQAVAAVIRMAATQRALIAMATARSACRVVKEMLPAINGNRETKDESKIRSMTANGAQEGSKAAMTEYMIIGYRALPIVSKIQNMVTPTTFPADSHADKQEASTVFAEGRAMPKQQIETATQTTFPADCHSEKQQVTAVLAARRPMPNQKIQNAITTTFPDEGHINTRGACSVLAPMLRTKQSLIDRYCRLSAAGLLFACTPARDIGDNLFR